MHFPYKSQNGILRHLYQTDKKYFANKNLFKYDSSGYGSAHYPQHAFDFNENTYWFSSHRYSEFFISFCFTKGYAQIKGYELKSPPGVVRPSVWMFSVSNDNENWSFISLLC